MKKIIMLCLLLASFGAVYAQTFAEMEKAAEAGDTAAQCKLASAYYDGKGVLKDPIKAVFWYEKAANQGNVKAQ